MVTIEDCNGTYTADTLAEARKLKAARARAVKKANERYEAARARATHTAYLMMERVLTRGSSPFVFIDPDTDAGKYLAEVTDAPDEFCTSPNGYTINLHMVRDVDAIGRVGRAKLSHRGEKLTGLIVDGGGTVRGVELEDAFGAEAVLAVAAYETADGFFECVRVEVPLVAHFHFRGERKVQLAPYNLAAALRGEVERLDKEMAALAVERAR